MTSILLPVLTSALLYISFTGLLPESPKGRNRLLMCLGFFLISRLLPERIGYLSIPVNIAFNVICLLAQKKNFLTNVVMSLSGFLLTVMINYIFTIPMKYLGYSAFTLHGKYPLPFLLVQIAATFLLFCILRRLVRVSRSALIIKSPRSIQLLVLAEILISVIVITVNIIYSEKAGYPMEILTYNGILISFFVLSTVILFYCLYRILRKDYDLVLKQQEQDALNDYLLRMESLYEDMRLFRHDYMNILSTLRYYIENNDMPALKNYYDTKITDTGKQLSGNDFLIGRLGNMKITEIKGLLFTKLIAAQNQSLQISLEIREPVCEICMDIVKLSRILGILLDNAIEASSSTLDKQLCIAVITGEEAVVFLIENSCNEIPIPLSLLMEKGKSTKLCHEGLGLYNVKQITDHLPNVFFSMSSGSLFRQTLEIRKENHSYDFPVSM